MQEKQDRMKMLYDGQTQLRAFNEADPVYTNLPHEAFWQHTEARDSRGQVITLELLDDRVIRRHEDNIRCRSSETPKCDSTVSRDDDLIDAGTTSAKSGRDILLYPESPPLMQPVSSTEK